MIHERPPADNLEGGRTVESRTSPEESPLLREAEGFEGSPPRSPSPPPFQLPADFREQDRVVPIANVGRVIKRSLPDGVKITNETKECIRDCLTEFILFITSEGECRGERAIGIGGKLAQRSTGWCLTLLHRQRTNDASGTDAGRSQEKTFSTR